MISYYAILILKAVTIIAALLSVIYAVGVVWRVEKKLDISYKLLLSGIIFFTLSEILEPFSFEGRKYIEFGILASRTLFAVFFLLGVLTMRDMVRHLDGEK